MRRMLFLFFCESLYDIRITARESYLVMGLILNFAFSMLQGVWKVTVHLQKVLEVMSTSIYTGLNPFNFILKHFLQICL
jgi:hypothetical protein